MAPLALIDEISRELRINDKGQAFVTIRGAARICGVSHSAIARSLSGDLNPSKLAAKLAENGFGGGDFAETGVPDTALSLIIEYYALDAGQNCTTQAMVVYRSFAAIGLRAWLQQQLGWVDESINTKLDEIKASIEALKNQQVSQTSKVEGLRLEAIRHPNPEVKEISTRKKIRQLVNDYCFVTNQNYRNVWQFLYDSYNIEYGYNLYWKARNSSNKLQHLEEVGRLDEFHQMATRLLMY